MLQTQGKHFMQLWSTFNLLTQLSDKDIAKSIARNAAPNWSGHLHFSSCNHATWCGAQHRVLADTCLEFAHAVCFSAATVILLNLQTLRSSFLQSVVSSHKVFIDIQFNFTRAIFTHITAGPRLGSPKVPTSHSRLN